MIVLLNNYSINDPSNHVYLDEPIDGLELPPIRTSSGNYAGRDGGYIGAQFYGGRPISLTGRAFSTDVAMLEQRRRDFQAAIKNGTVTMRIVTNGGQAYIIYANLIDFKMPINRNMFEAPFKLDLFAGDPIIYDDTGGGALTATVPKLTAGGYTYPVVYPVLYAPGSAPTTVTNGGTQAVYPTITLTDVMTNPVLTNKTTGQLFGLNLVTAPGDQVVIDMRQRTVLLNGGNIFADVAAGSSWWTLKPGGNDISLTTSSVGDTVAALVAWRSGYMGI